MTSYLSLPIWRQQNFVPVGVATLLCSTELVGGFRGFLSRVFCQICMQCACSERTLPSNLHRWFSRHVKMVQQVENCHRLLNLAHWCIGKPNNWTNIIIVGIS